MKILFDYEVRVAGSIEIEACNYEEAYEKFEEMTNVDLAMAGDTYIRERVDVTLEVK